MKNGIKEMKKDLSHSPDRLKSHKERSANEILSR